MGIFNYSNLKEQAKEAKESEANKGKPLDEGTFSAVLRNGELTMSQAKNDMFLLEWRVNAPGDKRMHRETLRMRFTATKNTQWQIDQFLSIMDDLGVDFTQIKKDRDWADVFEDMEEARVKASIQVYFNDDDKDDDGNVKPKSYPEMRIVEILKALPGATVEEEEDEKPKAKATPKAKPAPKKEKEEPKEEPAEEPAEEPEPANDDSGSDSDDDW